MAFQNSKNTKKSEEKMLMELYLNSNSGETSSKNILTRNHEMNKSVSLFEKRKEKLNESVFSEVSEADKVELDRRVQTRNRVQTNLNKNKTKNAI